MATYYYNEDLTTGLNDGSSEANAWQTWSVCSAGLTTLTEDTDVYCVSSGTVDQTRDANITTAGYTIRFFSDSDSTWVYTTGYANAFRIEVEGTGDLEMHGFILSQDDNGYGFRVDSNNSGASITMVNCVVVGTGSGYAYYNTGYSELNLYNCLGINIANGLRYGSNAGDMNIYNTYIYATTCYSSGGVGTLTLYTCASSDTTGSTGLQSIAYSTANFTNVTVGSEDFHLVDGSALIGAGTNTPYSTDIDGTSWEAA
jgi:hypothetical protein